MKNNETQANKDLINAFDDYLGIDKEAISRASEKKAQDDTDFIELEKALKEILNRGKDTDDFISSIKERGKRSF